jgi:hypothetical protein
MRVHLIWLFAWIAGTRYPGSGFKHISQIITKYWYEFLSMEQANIKFSEENQDWLNEWFGDNQVKTLAECKQWKEDTVQLEQPVAGIITANGFGCPGCQYSHDRKRFVASHMKRVHRMSECQEPTVTQVQVVFSSHLRSFFKVSEPRSEPPTQNDGLLASRAFRAEFEEIEAQDVPLSSGIKSQFSAADMKLLFQRTTD